MESNDPIPTWHAQIASAGEEIRRVVNAVWSVRRPPGIAVDDLVQMTVLELMKVRPVWQRPGPEMLRLAGVIAKRRAIDAVRSAGTHESSQPIADIPADPESESFLGDALQRAVTKALETLAPEERELLNMRFRDDLKLSEIAAVQNRSSQSVFNAIARSVGRLRMRLREMARKEESLRELLDEHWPGDEAMP